MSWLDYYSNIYPFWCLLSSSESIMSSPGCCSLSISLHHSFILFKTEWLVNQWMFTINRPSPASTVWLSASLLHTATELGVRPPLSPLYCTTIPIRGVVCVCVYVLFKMCRPLKQTSPDEQFEQLGTITSIGHHHPPIILRHHPIPTLSSRRLGQDQPCSRSYH